MTQIWIGRGQDQLAEFVVVKELVLRAVILPDDVLGVVDARVQVLLAHEVENFATGELPVVAHI